MGSIVILPGRDSALIMAAPTNATARQNECIMLQRWTERIQKEGIRRKTSHAFERRRSDHSIISGQRPVYLNRDAVSIVEMAKVSCRVYTSLPVSHRSATRVLAGTCDESQCSSRLQHARRLICRAAADGRSSCG